MLSRAIGFGLLLWNLPVFAQQDSAGPSKFSIGANASLELCYRMLAQNAGIFGGDNIVRARNAFEIPKINYSAGVTISFDPNERWSFISGLRYSDQGYRTEEATEFVSVDPIEEDPAIPIGGIRYVYHFHYLSVPLLVQFRLGKGRLRFTPSIGVAGDILLEPTETTHSKWKDGRETRETRSAAHMGYNPMSLSVRTELGGAYRIAERFELNAGLGGLYQVTKLIDDPIAGHLWNVGFQCGFRYRL